MCDDLREEVPRPKAHLTYHFSFFFFFFVQKHSLRHLLQKVIELRHALMSPGEVRLLYLLLLTLCALNAGWHLLSPFSL